MDHNLARLRLVTERFWELQGLRSALLGSVILVGLAVYVVLASLTDLAGGVSGTMGLVAALLILFPGMVWLDRYYATAFGRLKPSPAGRRFGMYVVPGVLLSAYLIEKVWRLPVFTLYFAAWGVIGLWVTIRDWPLRKHYLLEMAAAVVSAALQWKAVPHQDMAFPDPLALLVFGLGLALTGFMDHRLLASTMHDHTASGGAVIQHGDTI
jgi:hypothetical protein